MYSNPNKSMNIKGAPSHSYHKSQNITISRLNFKKALKKTQINSPPLIIKMKTMSTSFSLQ